MKQAKHNIQNKLAQKLCIGVNIYRDINPVNHNVIEDYISQEIPNIKTSHTSQIPPGFQWSRKLYRSFHLDPTKTRPSSEALWRRLKNKNDFPRVNHFVDLTNLLSLKFQICFGLYDSDKINGNIEVCLGQKGDTYQGIRKEVLNFKDKILLKDAFGPFGNPSSDSLRTSTETNSINILQVLFFHSDDPDAQKITEESGNVFKRLFEIKNSESYILT